MAEKKAQNDSWGKRNMKLFVKMEFLFYCKRGHIWWCQIFPYSSDELTALQKVNTTRQGPWSHYQLGKNWSKWL